MRLWGVTGWKNAGKTGLMERLVAEFVARGLTVSTLKHAHHTFDVDQPGKDSHRHRGAGATEVLVSSGARWALMHELRGAGEPPLEALLARMSPVDLVLVEGWKRDRHPKVEAHRQATGDPLIAPDDPTVRLVASDVPLALDRPVLPLDDTRGIADFIARELGLVRPQASAGAWFDSIAVVDWSGGNDTGSRPRKDAIWSAIARDGAVGAPCYLRNREVALGWLTELCAAELAAGRRVLLGFDFPFGYPEGFAAAVVGRSDPLALWDDLARRLTGPTGGNRFALAAELNALFPGVGPFWFNGGREDVAGLPRRGTDRTPSGLPERRRAEVLARGAFTCWQLGGAGAVGSQALTGMATLSRLRARFPGQVRVWPFEPLDAPVALVEVWPSLINDSVRAATGEGDIRDAVQVRVLAGALTAMQEAGTLAAALNAPPPEARREEGWILGVGAEGALRAAASVV